MGKFWAYQIIMGKYKYAAIVAKFPSYKEIIDTAISDTGWMIDSAGDCVAKTA